MALVGRDRGALWWEKNGCLHFSSTQKHPFFSHHPQVLLHFRVISHSSPLHPVKRISGLKEILHLSSTLSSSLWALISPHLTFSLFSRYDLILRDSFIRHSTLFWFSYLWIYVQVSRWFHYFLRQVDLNYSSTRKVTSLNPILALSKLWENKASPPLVSPSAGR